MSKKSTGFLLIGGLTVVLTFGVYYLQSGTEESNVEINSLKIQTAEADSSLTIYDRPIKFSSKRKELTLEYIKSHYDSQATSIEITPLIIVVHWTASEKLESLFSAFDPEELPLYRPHIQAAGKVNVSAQFAVDRNGDVYRLMPETWMARHVIGLNRIAIGIENIGGPKWPLTEEQLHANERLIRYLVKKYPQIKYLIGHYEYTRFRDTPLWQELDPNYLTTKQDPGKPFMTKLEKRVFDLNLQREYQESNE